MIKDEALIAQEIPTIYSDGDTKPFETDGVIEDNKRLTAEEVAQMEFLGNTLRHQINILLPQSSN